MQNAHLARQIPSRQRLGSRHDLCRRSFGNHSAAQPPCSRPKIQHIVRGTDRIFIVLHYQHSIAQIAQPRQRLDQPHVVALMQSDRRLIEHIQHSAQPRTNLRGQPNALAFATRQGRRIPIERKITEAHSSQKLQPLDYLFANPLRDQRLARRKLQLSRRCQRPVQRKRREIADRQPADFHSKRLWPQPLTPARRANRRRHEVHHVFAIAVALGVLHPIAQKRQNAVKPGLRSLGARRTVDQNMLLLVRQLLERGLQVDLIPRRRNVNELDQILRSRSRPQSAIQQRLRPIRNHLGRVEIVKRPKPMALRASAKRRVEAETPRLQLGYIQTAVRASHRGRKKLLFLLGTRRRRTGNQHQAVSHLQRLGHRAFEPFFDPRLQHNPVDDRFNGVILAPVEVYSLSQVAQFAVNSSAKPLLLQLIQQLAKLALAPPHHRRHDHHPLPLAQLQDALDDLLRGLAGDGFSTVRAVRRSYRGVKQPQVVVDLGDRAHGRARAAAGGLLLDRDCGAKSLNRIHIRPLDLIQKLARVGRKRLHVPPLALGVNRVERQRTLARSRKPRHHRQSIARYANIDIAQIMLPCATDRDVRNCHILNRIREAGKRHFACNKGSTSNRNRIVTIGGTLSRYSSCQHQEGQRSPIQ